MPVAGGPQEQGRLQTLAPDGEEGGEAERERARGEGGGDVLLDLAFQEPGLPTHVAVYDLECVPPHAIAGGQGGDEAEALQDLWTTLTDRTGRPANATTASLGISAAEVAAHAAGTLSGLMGDAPAEAPASESDAPPENHCASASC